MNKLCEAIGQYGVQCSETKELAPPEYLLAAIKEHDAAIREKTIKSFKLFIESDRGRHNVPDNFTNYALNILDKVEQ